jgi:long-chain acyl-CoA synthetase
LDADEIQAWAKKEGFNLSPKPTDWATDPRVMALIDSEVAEANRHLASYESVKYHRVLPHDFSIETGELTPSLKVKRKVVTEKYRDLIQQMY